MKMNYDVDRKLYYLFDLKDAVDNVKCTEMINFEEQFEAVYKRSELESEKNKLQLKLSDEGLSLYPEYANAVALLKDLGYIDNDERGLFFHRNYKHQLIIYNNFVLCLQLH